jgi:microcompartment protein CcmK/EutM
MNHTTRVAAFLCCSIATGIAAQSLEEISQRVYLPPVTAMKTVATDMTAAPGDEIVSITRESGGAYLRVYEGLGYGFSTNVVDSLFYSTASDEISLVSGAFSSRSTGRAICFGVVGPSNLLSVRICTLQGRNLLLHRAITIPAATAEHDLFAADFDGDGRDELVVTCVERTNRVSIRSYDLSSLTSPRLLASGSVTVDRPQHAGATADFDGDGRAELALVTDQTRGAAIQVFSFTLNPSVPTRIGDRRIDSSTWQHVVTAGDIDRDGIAEVVVAGSSSSSPFLRSFRLVSILLVDGASWPITALPDALGVADLDRDGRRELLRLDGSPQAATLTAHEGTSSATMVGLVPLRGAPTAGGAIAVGDYDGDGRDDAVCLTGGSATQEIHVLECSTPARIVDGCPGSNGLRVRIAVDDRGVDISNLQPHASAFVIWSETRYDPPLDVTVLGAPGCLLVPEFVGVTPFTSNSGGTARVSIPFTNWRRHFVQVIAVDPGANAIGLTASEAADVNIRRFP